MTQNSTSTVHITPGCDISCKSMFSKQEPLHISSSKNPNLEQYDSVFLQKTREGRFVAFINNQSRYDLICCMAVFRAQVAV